MDPTTALMTILCTNVTVYDRGCIVNLWALPDCVPWRPLACVTQTHGNACSISHRALFRLECILEKRNIFTCGISLYMLGKGHYIFA